MPVGIIMKNSWEIEKKQYKNATNITRIAENLFAYKEGIFT
jgi:hypothetical protein